ncbi:MAG: hypothetical protein IJG55_10070, partial [Synergistaceae bacterium]|nr:hypothetical protein [Synergistaceae bacterium]
MKKFSRAFYFMLMALTVFMFAGCGGSDDDDNAAKNKLMVLTSPVFTVGESYKLYMGNKVSLRGTDARYYVAPDAGNMSELVTLNLQFRDAISDDVPFVITTADNDASIIFAYNPRGTTESDVTTSYGSVIRYGGGTQQLKYDGLSVSGASASSYSSGKSSFMASAIDIDLDTSEEIVITLNGDEARIASEDVPEYDYVWHADPNHRDEYFTDGSDSTTELTEAQMNAEIEPLEGVYIARDVRYTPNNISFRGTAKKDDKTDYVSYYSDSVATQAAAELGTGFEGPYIFAALPAVNAPGNVLSPNSNSDIDAYSV